MTTVITLDLLTKDSVSVKTQQYVTVDGIEYAAGKPHRCAYINSERGRAEIAAALEEPYLSVVMDLWGDTATMMEE